MAPRDGRVGRRGGGRAAAVRGLEHLAEAQLRRAADVGQLAVLAGQGDDDVPVALGDHFGLGHAVGVDPALDDLPRLFEVLRGRRLAVDAVGGLERQPGAADQVQAEPGLQPVLPAAAGAAREEHQKIEDDEDEPEYGELPPGAHLSLRWCHGCPVSL
ncbi:hypothetical protein JNW89_15355 [Micromonospora sp. 4G55]|nr:hypothetical protein [Micromonospora sp. 4G55]